MERYLRKPPTLPTGPRLYRKIGLGLVSGPGSPPPGFLGPHGSAEEWMVYWGFAKIFKDPEDPRQPPYTGGRAGRWTYQAPFLGGRHIRGGAVVDFVVYASSGEAIGFRLQTERYHIFTLSPTHAFDEAQMRTLSESIRLVDIYSQDFVGDASGQAVIIALKEAMAGFTEASPLGGGEARRQKMATN